MISTEKIICLVLVIAIVFSFMNIPVFAFQTLTGKSLYNSELYWSEVRQRVENDSDNKLKNCILFRKGYNRAYINKNRFDIECEPLFSKDGIYVPLNAILKYYNTDFKYAEEDIKLVNNIKMIGIYKFQKTFVYDETGLIIIGLDEAAFDLEKEMPIIYEAGNLVATNRKLTAKKSGSRPILFETDEMLEISRKMIEQKKNPWYNSWQRTKIFADNALKSGPLPSYSVSSTQYRFAACKDFVNAYAMALAYYMTDALDYLDGAIKVLNAYSKSSPILGSDEYLDYSAEKTDGKADIGLNIAVPLTTACEVYSLLYPYMSEVDKNEFEKWIKLEVEIVKRGHNYWLDNDYYDYQYGNNHLSSHLEGLISAAYVLEDDELLNYAVVSDKNDSNYKDMINKAILMSGEKVYKADTDSNFEAGEIIDRYRAVQNNGFGYAMYHLKFLTHAAVFMKNNDNDFFGYYGIRGENLELPYIVYSKYLINNDDSLFSGHYKGNNLNRSSAFSIYNIARYMFNENEEIENTIEALENDSVDCYELEQLTYSSGMIFGVEDKEKQDEALPYLSDILVDGEQIEGFDAEKTMYTVSVSTLDIPKVIGYGDGIITVTDTQSLDQYTKIEIADRNAPEKKRVYKIKFVVAPKIGLPENRIKYDIKKVTVSDQSLTEGGTIGRNAIDGDINTRWSAEGKAHWIQLDLGDVKSVDSVAIAFYSGSKRQTFFNISTSIDGRAWCGAFVGESSGATDDFEVFPIKLTKARYVRISCKGNSMNNWNSINEIAVY